MGDIVLPLQVRVDEARKIATKVQAPRLGREVPEEIHGPTEYVVELRAVLRSEGDFLAWQALVGQTVEVQPR